MEILINILMFVLGLCMGSFVNMLVYRKAVEYKLMTHKFGKVGNSRSFCDFCGRQLKWYENVPVISWLVLKGSTRCCRRKLPVLYPIVEIGTGIMLMMFNLKYPWWQVDIKYWILGIIVLTLIIFLTVFDYKYMILPDFAIIMLIILASLSLVFYQDDLTNYLISSVLTMGFLAFLNLITKGKGMGWGDVKLAVFMGLWLGYPKIIVAMYLAFITGALVSLVLIIRKRATKKSLIAFGPFLLLGVVISWWWGDNLWQLVWG